MKLARFGNIGSEKPALVDETGDLRDLSGVIDDITGATIDDETLARLAALDPASLPLVQGNPRIGACIGNVGKIIAIGLNYSDHAREAGMDVPTEPVIFHKATSALCGPNDDLEIPRGASKLDWEVELAVIIGKRAKYVTEDEALDHVAGYASFNDASERDFQINRLGQWTKGKCHDTFAPLGPWLVTRDEVADPQALRLTADVDGQRMQDGTTATMIFGVKTLISYLSQFMTLEPGDVIATGTPPGVGMGQKPEPVFLKEGQILEVEVQGLGRQRHKVVAA